MNRIIFDYEDRADLEQKIFNLLGAIGKDETACTMCNEISGRNEALTQALKAHNHQLKQFAEVKQHLMDLVDYVTNIKQKESGLSFGRLKDEIRLQLNKIIAVAIREESKND